MKLPVPMGRADWLFLVCLIGIGLSWVCIHGVGVLLALASDAEYDLWAREVKRLEWLREETLFWSVIHTLFWSAAGLPFLAHTLWEDGARLAERKHCGSLYLSWNR